MLDLLDRLLNVAGGLAAAGLTTAFAGLSPMVGVCGFAAARFFWWLVEADVRA